MTALPYQPVPTYLMALPRCEQHGAMELQKPGTKEQEYCGTWYRCTRCTTSVLLTSPPLERDLSAARLRIGAAK